MRIEPEAGEGELDHVGLAEDHGSRLTQAADDHGVRLCRRPIA